MTRKEIYKHIGNIAKELPPDTYDVLDRWTQEVVSTHPVNHKRRLKTLWNRHQDINILNEYLHKYGRELKPSLLGPDIPEETL